MLRSTRVAAGLFLALAAMTALAALASMVACGVLPPDPPIECSRREAALASGFVVEIENTSEQTISLWIESGDQRDSFSLGPGETETFGWLKGYQFGENSSFAVGGEGFSTKRYSLSELPATPSP